MTGIPCWKTTTLYTPYLNPNESHCGACGNSCGVGTQAGPKGSTCKANVCACPAGEVVNQDASGTYSCGFPVCSAGYTLCPGTSGYDCCKPPNTINPILNPGQHCCGAGTVRPYCVDDGQSC